ncbi:MAG TPA: maltose alpha-D-glucosyltransferase [Dehalococcoidia bacterium]|nr:maltose alpha-D-glucosyltransferase [Dehalococcoidia bacterium]
MTVEQDDIDVVDGADWYKDAVIYELHVRAFADSDGDGIGDFVGLTQKLDYLKDLGVTAIWLLPFYPSPLLDDGYDIADYTDVHPAYGSLRDVRTFIREAHRRGLKVITELVCNHTSDQHAWFQRARRAAPGSPQRDFYVWSDTAERYKETRIIFKDFETSNWSWDAHANAYFWHRFYHHQPDLNFDNPRVREAIMRVMDFWLEMGVDGLRLDAIPYLYERDGTSNENLPETYGFLRELRSHIDANFEGRMLLAEANQWPEDAVAYFGDGDLCQMAFHFPLMPRLFMSIHMEDRFPIVDIVRQTPQIPENCQWAVFLRNHDELTLEMVTDEERDYMYRVYAVDQSMRINLGIRRRLAPLLGNHRRRVELMNGLLFALPGTPVIYYGDEIGMGDNVYLGDRNGVRTPMQWSGDRNAGFSKANPQKLFLPVIIDPEYNYETVNVEAQLENPHSLLWWTRRLIALRKRYQAFGRGTMEFLSPENRKVLAFIRRYEGEAVLVVANLSRFVQGVTLDLTEFKGMVLVEMFGRIEMPGVIDGPYFLTLGPHSFYWFALEPARVEVGTRTWLNEEGEAPLQAVAGGWQQLITGAESAALAKHLPAFLGTRRWFAGKGRAVRSASIEESVPLPARAGARNGTNGAQICFINVQYAEGAAETYLLPLAYKTGEEAYERQSQTPDAVFLRLTSGEGEEGILYDAMYDVDFADSLLRLIERGTRQHARDGDLAGNRTAVLRQIARPGDVQPNVLRADQSNTSINYGDALLLKLFRKVEPGVNPDYEIGSFLTEQAFDHAPRVAGAIEYQRHRKESITLAVLSEYIHKESDAWQLTMDSLRDYFDRTSTMGEHIETQAATVASLLRLTEEEAPPLVGETIGAFAESARLLGVRTAEMHAALASGPEGSEFVQEAFTPFYQRSLYQSMRNVATNSFALLAQRVKADESASPEAIAVMKLEDTILARFRDIVNRPLSSTRVRNHGDFHLGQVLYTGNDFVITDFEGEPARSLTERRLKRSPLRDVAGMLRSFSYAVHSALRERQERGLPEESSQRAGAWGRFWQVWVSSIYLGSYLEEARNAGFFNATPDEVELLLDLYMLEKAIYEVGYELNNRPDWLSVPLQGILELLQVEA